MKPSILTLQKTQTFKIVQNHKKQVRKSKTFYFFIENEFICRSDCNLFHNEYSIKYFTTVNLIKLSRELDPVTYKIYFQSSEFGLCKRDMKKLYKQIGEYINCEFISKNESAFIGCVRDDNETHKLCTESNLKFKCRTDPIHDIFNILKNIYVSTNNSYQFLKFEDRNDSVKFCYNDLKIFLDKHANLSLPKVGFFDIKKDEKFMNHKRIWMPNRNVQLEKFIIPFRCLFSINYFLKINKFLQETEGYKIEYKEAYLLVKLILILQNIYEMQHRFLKREEIQNLENYLEELNNFKIFK